MNNDVRCVLRITMILFYANKNHKEKKRRRYLYDHSSINSSVLLLYKIKQKSTSLKKNKI